MKKNFDRSRKSAVLSRSVQNVIEPLEQRVLLTGVVLAAQTPITPPVSVSFTTVTTNAGQDADFNGDGKTDLVVSDQANDQVALFPGNGNGTFGTPVVKSLGAGTSPLPVVLADMNGDGKLDIVTGNTGTPGSVSVISGDGAGGLATPLTYPTTISDNQAIAVADFNGDGRPDIVTVSHTQGAAVAAEILLQQSDGSFTQQATINVGHTGLAAVAAGDFNGDGKQDLAIVDQFNNAVTVLLGNGDGTFQTPHDYGVGTSPTSIAVADFNGDSKLDLVTANSTGGTVSFLQGNGDGTFKAKVDSAVVGSSVGSGPLKVRTSNFNGGAPDLMLLLNNNPSKLDGAVLLGNGDGTFHTGTTIATNGAFRSSLAAGDLNGDGLTDALVANATGGSNTSQIVPFINVTNQDQTAPTGTVPGNQPAATAGATTYQFNVTYNDNTQVDASTLGNGNLTVTGPNGYSQPATLVSQNLGNGPSVTATYSIPFPAGLTTADNGTYTVHANGGSGAVTDANGNAIGAGSLGTFNLTVGQASGGLITVSPPIFTGKVLPSVVAGSKGKPVKIKVTNSGTTTASGTYQVTLYYTPTPPNGGLPGDSVVLAQTAKKVKLKPGKSTIVVIRKWNYPTIPGIYYFVSQVTGAPSGPATNATATATNVAAPFIDLHNLWNGVAPVITPGKKMSFAFKVLNQGNVPAKGTATVNLLATPSSTDVTGAQTVAAVPVHVSIQPGKTGTVHVRFTPATLTPGTYHLAVTIAPLNFLGINFSNNTVISSNTFTV